MIFELKRRQLCLKLVQGIVIKENAMGAVLQFGDDRNKFVDCAKISQLLCRSLFDNPQNYWEKCELCRLDFFIFFYSRKRYLVLVEMIECIFQITGNSFRKKYRKVCEIYIFFGLEPAFLLRRIFAAQSNFFPLFRCETYGLEMKYNKRPLCKNMITNGKKNDKLRKILIKKFNRQEVIRINYN